MDLHGAAFQVEVGASRPCQQVTTSARKVATSWPDSVTRSHSGSCRWAMPKCGSDVVETAADEETVTA